MLYSLAGVLKTVPLCLDRPAGWSKDPHQRSASHHRPAAALWLPAALWSSRHSSRPVVPLAWPARGGVSGRRGQGRRPRGQRPERARHAFRVPGQRGRREGKEMTNVVVVFRVELRTVWVVFRWLTCAQKRPRVWLSSCTPDASAAPRFCPGWCCCGTTPSRRTTPDFGTASGSSFSSTPEKAGHMARLFYSERFRWRLLLAAMGHWQLERIFGL